MFLKISASGCCLAFAYFFCKFEPCVAYKSVAYKKSLYVIFRTFQLLLEITYVAFCFVNLLYLFLRQNYVVNTFLIMIYFSRRYDYVFLWYVCITSENNVTITFRFCSSLLRIFYYVTVSVFICSMQLRLLIKLESLYVLVRLNCVR